jgi:hypothetical protein
VNEAESFLAVKVKREGKGYKLFLVLKWKLCISGRKEI